MFDLSVRKQTLKETENTQENMNETVNHELLTFVNVLLHASYQFLFLETLSRSFAMPGTTWITKRREEKSREEAVTLLDWIKANDGYLEFADISKPKFDESEINAEFVFKRWDEVEKWISSNIEESCNKIRETHYVKKNEIVRILRGVESNIMSTD